MHEQSDGRRWSGGGHQQGQCQSSTPSKSQRPGSSPPLSHPFLTVYPHTDVPNKRILCFLPSNKKQERERRGERGGLKDRGSVLEHRGTALNAANSCSRVHRLGWARPCSIQKGTNAPDNVPTAQAEEPSERARTRARTSSCRVPTKQPVHTLSTDVLAAHPHERQGGARASMTNAGKEELESI